jgi:hypothetical protein
MPAEPVVGGAPGDGTGSGDGMRAGDALGGRGEGERWTARRPSCDAARAPGPETSGTREQPHPRTHKRVCAAYLEVSARSFGMRMTSGERRTHRRRRLIPIETSRQNEPCAQATLAAAREAETRDGARA